MKDTVYLETSVISYYTARPAIDVVVLAHQEITRQWWKKAVNEFEIFISQAVVDEAKEGDPVASEERLNAIAEFQHLELNSKVGEMTDIYISNLEIPPKAVGDAIHIANGTIIKKLAEINAYHGVHTPVLCTPEELLE